MKFRFPDIDNFSFWLGLILASIIWWMFSLLHPAVQHLRLVINNKRSENNRNRHTNNKVEEQYRQYVFQKAQGSHLAAPLFSLNEIVELPLLLAPPPRVEPGAPFQNEDMVSAIIPYLPAWPELASIYNAPTLSLAEALSGNSDIVLTGKPGMGKTVALAYLASRLAHRDPEPGLPQDTLPFLLHVADLNYREQKEEPLKHFIESIYENARVFDQRSFNDFVRKVFSEGRALILLDGTDELTPDVLINVVDIIKAIKRAYPNTRMVTTASSEYLDGLVTLNFIPFALASWNSKQQLRFIERWGDLWTNYVAVEVFAPTIEQVNPLLLNSWLNAENWNLTPLELTLKIWGAYAGDLCGPGPLNAIETHVRRLTPVNVQRSSLAILASQVGINSEPIFDAQKAKDWIKPIKPSNSIDPGTREYLPINTLEEGHLFSTDLIIKLLESGLLTKHYSQRMRFIHPVFCGYLSGNAFSKFKTENLINQPPWIGKYLMLHFFSTNDDITPVVEYLLSLLDRPLSRNLLLPARWLRDAPSQMGWRQQVIFKLSELLQQTGQPLGLRGQALCALLICGEPGVSNLFRQLLKEHDYDLLQLVALGSGAIRDTKAIELVSSLLSSQSSNVRSAACLSLVNIGTTTAMDFVAQALLHGDENLRRAAAEALANHPSEGHAMLKEGAVLKEDILVRRSVVYGLGRIHEPWAEELLSFMETQDEQWAVRNAAAEVRANCGQPNPNIPRRLPPPTESPWIITFAGKQGLGVSTDKPPIDLLLLALKSGTEEERLASLAYLRMMPTEGVFGALYQAMYCGVSTLREAVFQTLNEMAARGVDVPDPIQFGVG
jgi:hypothetical protein